MDDDSPLFREVARILSETGFATEQEDDMRQLFDNLLSPEETNMLIISLNVFRSNAGFSDEEIIQLIAWAKVTRFHTMMLESVLQKKLLINVVEGDDFRFRQPSPEELAWIDVAEKEMKERGT